MAKIAVLFHSGYGHTRKQAEAVLEGASSVAEAQLIAIDAEGLSGALAQSPSDASPDEAPGKGDLETARQFGARVAAYAVKTRG